MDSVQKAAVEALVEAIGTCFEAKIGYGVGYCGKEQGIGGNRHDPEKYCQDPDVAVLAISDDACVRGILVNYALHPTVMPADSDRITADYMAALRMTVLKKYPNAVFGFMQGCSGNQSIHYFRTEQSEDVLKDLKFSDLKKPMQVKKSLFYWWLRRLSVLLFFKRSFLSIR